jgi:hypothetical protein
MMEEEEEEILNLQYGQYNKIVQHVNYYFSTAIMNTETPVTLFDVSVSPVQPGQ